MLENISTISTFSSAKHTGVLPYKYFSKFFLDNGYINGIILLQNGNKTDIFFVTTYRDLKNEISYDIQCPTNPLLVQGTKSKKFRLREFD